MVDEWLQTKGCTMWMNWDITDDDERRDAAMWFIAQTDDLNLFIDSNYEPSGDRISMTL